MFRMGGRSDDGIMSVRPGYSEGGPSLDAIIKGKELQQPGTTIITDDYIKNEYDKYLDKIYTGDISDVDIAYGMQVLPPVSPKDAGILEFAKTQPEKSFELFKQESGLGDKQKEQKQIAKDAGLDLFPEVNVADKNTDTGTGTTNTETGTSTTDKVSDEDTIKSYIKMFSDAFGESPEDASRERFLQLAKFGANLLAQPGGDLVGAIGKAAAPSIEGLAASEAARRAGDREVKLAAVKTAIEKMDDPTADKIKTLARIAGVPEEEVAKLMITGSGDSKMDRIETTAKALATTVGEEPALKIAQVLEEEGAVLAQASPIEIDPKTKKPKEGVSDGYYYDESGKVYKVEDGKPSIVKIK